MNRVPLAVAGVVALVALGGWGIQEYDVKHRATVCPICPTSASNPAAPTATGATMASATAPSAPTETFQPYVLVNQPAPKPAHVTEYHRHLTLKPHDGEEYLADSSGRYYHVGRDAQGHIYPAYYDNVTDQTYPLYYDPSRDNYYRVCQSDNRYYRCYTGDESSRYYESDDDEDYTNYHPPYNDCPIISDPYTTFTYFSEPTYYYQPAEYHHRWHDNDWLWSVPILIGAYFVLDRHSSPDYGYYYGYDRGPRTERTVIRENIYNAPVTYYEGGRQVSYYASVAPRAKRKSPASSGVATRRHIVSGTRGHRLT